MEALSNRLELPLRDLAHETEFRGAAALPVADHGAGLLRNIRCAPNDAPRTLARSTSRESSS
jgi:hypothetical protein